MFGRLLRWLKYQYIRVTYDDDVAYIMDQLNRR